MSFSNALSFIHRAGSPSNKTKQNLKNFISFLTCPKIRLLYARLVLHEIVWMKINRNLWCQSKTNWNTKCRTVALKICVSIKSGIRLMSCRWIQWNHLLKRKFVSSSSDKKSIKYNIPKVLTQVFLYNIQLKVFH